MTRAVSIFLFRKPELSGKTFRILAPCSEGASYIDCVTKYSFALTILYCLLTMQIANENWSIKSDSKSFPFTSSPYINSSSKLMTFSKSLSAKQTTDFASNDASSTKNEISMTNASCQSDTGRGCLEGSNNTGE